MRIIVAIFLSCSLLARACENGSCCYPIPLTALPRAVRGYSFLIAHELFGRKRAILRAQKKKVQQCASACGFAPKSNQAVVNTDIQNALAVFEYLHNQKTS